MGTTTTSRRRATLVSAHRANLAALRRLQVRLANGEVKRNVGATYAAIERRQDRDRQLLQQLAIIDTSPMCGGGQRG